MVKTLKNLLLWNQKADTLKLGMRHLVLEYYQVCSNDDPGLTLTYLMARSNLVPYALCRKKVKQWICMPPTLKKLTGHIGFGLSVHLCMRPFETCMPYLMNHAC